MKSLLLALLLILAPTAATSVTIGSTTFALGENAFPNASTCINASGCPGDTLLLDSSLNPVPREEALLGHDLSLVVIDMDETNEFRLAFPQAIVNLPGDDLYLAQAAFTGDPDLEDGIQDMQIRFGDAMPWQTIASTQFSEDLLAGNPIVTIGDPEARQIAYALWFTTLDLADFGFASGAELTGFDLRGLAGEGGLDAALAGNLNVPEPETGLLLAAGLLGLALTRSARGLRRLSRRPARGTP